MQFNFILNVEICVPELRSVDKPTLCVVYLSSSGFDVSFDRLA